MCTEYRIRTGKSSGLYFFVFHKLIKNQSVCFPCASPCRMGRPPCFDLLTGTISHPGGAEKEFHEKAAQAAWGQSNWGFKSAPMFGRRWYTANIFESDLSIFVISISCFSIIPGILVNWALYLCPKLLSLSHHIMLSEGKRNIWMNCTALLRTTGLCIFRKINIYLMTIIYK